MKIEEFKALAVKAGMSKFQLSNETMPREDMFVIGADFLDRLYGLMPEVQQPIAACIACGDTGKVADIEGDVWPCYKACGGSVNANPTPIIPGSLKMPEKKRLPMNGNPTEYAAAANWNDCIDAVVLFVEQEHKVLMQYKREADALWKRVNAAESKLATQTMEVTQARYIAAIDSTYPIPDNPHNSVIQKAMDDRVAFKKGWDAANDPLKDKP